MVERGAGGMPLPDEGSRVDPAGARRQVGHAPNGHHQATCGSLPAPAADTGSPRRRATTTRPTSDFVRETAFNLIGPVDGAAVLDLYAGSGAMGLEALSRGADERVFVESDREACRTINANLDKLQLQATRALPGRAARAGGRPEHLRPRALRPAVRRRRTRLAPHLARLLAPDGLLVYESSGREPPPDCLSSRRRRRASTVPPGLRCST